MEKWEKSEYEVWHTQPIPPLAAYGGTPYPQSTP